MLVAQERSADHHVTVTVPLMLVVATAVGVDLVNAIVYVFVVVPFSAVTSVLSDHVLPAEERLREVVPLSVAYALLAIGVEVIVPINE